MSSTGAAPSKRRRPAAPAAVEPGPAASLQHLISDELKAELKRNEIDDAEDPANALILPSKRQRPGPKAAVHTAPVAPVLSKSQRKKLQRLEEEKQRKAQRKELFEKLSASKLTAEQQRLLHATSSMGQKPTLKQRVQRAFYEEKAGLPSDGSHKVMMDHTVDPDTDGGESLSDAVEEHPAHGVSAPNVTAPVHKVAAPLVKANGTHTAAQRPALFSGWTSSPVNNAAGLATEASSAEPKVQAMANDEFDLSDSADPHDDDDGDQSGAAARARRDDSSTDDEDLALSRDRSIMDRLKKKPKSNLRREQRKAAKLKAKAAAKAAKASAAMEQLQHVFGTASQAAQGSSQPVLDPSEPLDTPAADLAEAGRASAHSAAQSDDDDVINLFLSGGAAAVSGRVTESADDDAKQLVDRDEVSVEDPDGEVEPSSTSVVPVKAPAKRKRVRSSADSAAAPPVTKALYAVNVGEVRHISSDRQRSKRVRTELVLPGMATSSGSAAKSDLRVVAGAADSDAMSVKDESHDGADAGSDEEDDDAEQAQDEGDQAESDDDDDDQEEEGNDEDGEGDDSESEDGSAGDAAMPNFVFVQPATIFTDSDSMGYQLTNNPFVYPSTASGDAPATTAGDTGSGGDVKTSAAMKTNKFTVAVERLPAIDEQRSELPIFGQEQEIVEAIVHNPVVIVCGPTGSGKTTQVPQFLYESGFGSLLPPDQSPRGGLIGVTEPRRVAAVSTAKRVAEELNLPFEHVVSYQIRYTSRVGADTKIKFMTDGILLREVQQDFLLRKYSVLILDEAHERNLNTDMLIGILSRMLPLRNKMADDYRKWLESSRASATSASDAAVTLGKQPPAVTPLRLVIMSATLRIDDFVKNSHLFRTPPRVLEVGSRQYPVTIHFNRRTPPEHDYLNETFRKVVKIHTRLPPGAVLVFLTGRQEIEDMVTRLRDYFTTLSQRREKRKAQTAIPVDSNAEAAKTRPAVALLSGAEHKASAIGAQSQLLSSSFAKNAFPLTVSGGVIDSNGTAADGAVLSNPDTGMMEIIGAEEGAADDDDDDDGGGAGSDANANRTVEEQLLAEADNDDVDDELLPVTVLPLYSLLPTQQQLRVFEPVDERATRLIVLATNVAETSLTIPGVKYVVDPGKEKRREYDRATGTSQFIVTWISKAAASQRAGRAGRTAPGHAYRLYSSAVFNDQFDEFPEPEILRNPIEGTVLQMKSMSIDRVADFPFPTPPDRIALRSALHTLQVLGALSRDDERITPLGKTLAAFPVAPRFAKMLALSVQGGCLAYIIAIVSSLSVQQLFLEFHTEKQSAFEGKDDAEQAKQGAKSKRDASGAAADWSGVTVRHDAEDMAVDDADGSHGDVKDVEERKRKAALMKGLEAAKLRWSNRQSDLLTNLRVVGGYVFALAAAEKTARKSIEAKRKRHVTNGSHRSTSDDSAEIKAAVDQAAAEFCRLNFVRAKAMTEVEDLIGQLCRIMLDMRECLQIQAGAESKASSSSSLQRELEMLESAVGSGKHLMLKPPSDEQEVLLRQLITAGLVDRVARKIPRSLGAAGSGDKQKWHADHADDPLNGGLGAYQCTTLDEPVFIHPRSGLFPKEFQPQYVCYHEIMRSTAQSSSAGKPYLKGVTAIQPEWLFLLAPELCVQSRPLETPAPKYDAATDRVLCYVDVQFSPPHSHVTWQLPVQTIEHPAGAERIRHFVRLFMEGKVFSKMLDIRPYLVGRTSSIPTEPSARVNALMAPFYKHAVDSKAKLLTLWSKNPTFALKEVQGWVSPNHQRALADTWPPTK